jgi:hypothetical protein
MLSIAEHMTTDSTSPGMPWETVSCAESVPVKDWKKEEVVAAIQRMKGTARMQWYREVVSRSVTGHGRWKGNLYYVEDCVPYVEGGGEGIGYSGARAAWKELEGLGIWEKKRGKEVEKEGFMVRTLRKGQRHGQHLVMSREVWKGLKEIGGEKEVGRGQWFTEGWLPLQTVGNPVPGGKGVGKPCKVKCPYHADHHASASIWLNEDGKRGGGICFKCMKEEGGALTFAVQVVEGKYMAKPKHMQESVSKEEGVWQIEGEVMACQTRLEQIEQRVHPVAKPEEQAGFGWKGYRGGWGKKTIVYETDDQQAYWQGGMERIECMQTGVVQLERGEEYSYLSQARYASGSVYEVLERENTMSLWPSRVQKALEWEAKKEQEEPGTGAWLPDRLMHVSQVKYEKQWVGTPGNQFPVWANPQALYQRNILLDVDHLEGKPEEVEQGVIAWVQQQTQTEQYWSGRYGVVRTSPQGIQVWMELDRMFPATSFFQNKQVQRWLLQLKQGIEQAIHAQGGSGEVDTSAFAPGRLGRRPGWRTLRTGGVYRACVLALNKVAKTEDKPSRWRPWKKAQRHRKPSCTLTELSQSLQEAV